MNGFEKRRQLKKKYILDAFTDLVMARNFKEIGVREIAQCAGVSPSSIYKFFGSKEELAKQLLHKKLEEASENIRKNIRENIPFREKVKILYEISNESQNLLYGEGLKNLLFDDADFKKYFENYVQKVYNSIIIRLIDQGRKEGEISDAISTKVIMMFLRCIIDTMANPDIRDNIDVELRKEFNTLFFYGLLGKREHEE